jgi:hypothetical protein
MSMPAKSVISNGQTVSLIKFSVHKITILFFKSKSKYEISTHSLPRWQKMKNYRTSVPQSFCVAFVCAVNTKLASPFRLESSLQIYILRSLEDVPGFRF